MEAEKEMIQEFDSLTADFAALNLIEAAAGTGKTYNIQNITVRLLLSEPDLRIGQMAILSFTNEAAAELQKRLAAILKAAWQVSTQLRQSPEISIKKLSDIEKQALQILQNIPGYDPDAGCKIIHRALRDMDDAAISTINGFCHRILSENTFESGVLFSTALDTAPDRKLDRCISDFLRLFNLDTAYRNIFALPSITEILTRLRDPKATERLNVQDVSLVLPELDSTPFELAGKAVEALDKILAKTEPSGVGKKLFSDELLKEINNTNDPELEQDIAVLEFCIGKIQTILPLYMCRKVREEFDKLKKRENFMTYSDQITRVHQALYQENSPLKKQLQQKYRIGIIDEFQDTDALQYAIFKAIFFDDDIPDKTLHKCFLVGDPRQAIYLFRGGDLPAYLKARRYAMKHGKVFYLNTNRRSCAGIVEAANQIFGNETHGNAFHHPELGFPTLKVPANCPAEMKTDGSQTAFMRHRLEENKADTFAACADRICNLLSDNSKELLAQDKNNPSSRRLIPSDITVLVAKHFDARKMQKLLHERNIPSVCSQTGNVFEEELAKELHTVFLSLLEPDNRTMRNTALCTSVCHLAPAAVADDSSVAFQDAREKLLRISQCWSKKGFAAMFDLLLAEFNVLETFAAQPDGERKISIILQLQELLLSFSKNNSLSPDALNEELAYHIANWEKEKNIEAYQIYRHTDGPAVRIKTFHASKGLQFNVVMLPFVQMNISPACVEHDDDGNRLFPSADSGAKCTTEGLQEQLRLLYVAITRAIYRCEVFERPPDNECAWSHLTADGNRNTPLPEAWDAPPELLDVAGKITLFHTVKPLQKPSKLPEVPDDYQMISYSYLCEGASAHGAGTSVPEILDHDGADEDISEASVTEASPRQDNSFSPFDLPRGENFGTAMHWIFEKASFRYGQEEFYDLTRSAVRKYKLLSDGREEDELFLRSCANWLHNVYQTRLTPIVDTPFTLSELSDSDRICEMEFHCSLSAFELDEVKELLDDYARSDELNLQNWPENWQKSFSGGILHGFIDMIFRRNGKYYIVDWKSNYCGGSEVNFRSDNLKSVMTGSMYFLQYLIYLVALVRHLRRFSHGVFGEAEYEKQFGCVFYIFPRGIDKAAPGNGIFRARPPWEIVEKLERLLCGPMK